MKLSLRLTDKARAHSKTWIGVAVVLLLVSPIATQAELGGNAASVQADQEHIKGSLRVTAAGNYSVHEIQGESGVTVREFVSSSGTVFGVAWQGPWAPDMRQLLGPYFDQYVQAIQSQRPRHGAVSIHQAGLVVESGGHMRSFSGRAYLPQMKPVNVDVSLIK